jgi:glutamate--cysteine ligase
MPNIKDVIHDRLCKKKSQVDEWFASKAKGYQFPIYSSYDIRDSGFRVAPVDANIYPAGFNNLCTIDRKEIPKLFLKYIRAHYDPSLSKIALLTEEHTSNAFYWDNVVVLKELLQNAGFQLRVCIPKTLPEPITIKSASGVDVQVCGANRFDGKVVLCDGFVPELIISNNDFSDAHKDWANGLNTPLTPPREMGWYQRKKSLHFEFYNALAKEFGELLEVDPWVLQVRTELVTHFDVADRDSRESLADRVDQFIAGLRTQYQIQKIDQEPVVFIKNNAGTYGLAVTQVKSGDEIRKWNAKSRQKMQAAKGGKEVEEIIIQEGVPSVVKSDDNVTAEPVIYMVGDHLAGGF